MRSSPRSEPRAAGYAQGLAETPRYRTTFFRLLGFLRPYKWSLGVSVLLAVGTQAAAIAAAYLTGDALAHAIQSEDREALWRLVSRFSPLGLPAPSSWWAGGYLRRQALGVEFDMRNQLYAKLLRLSFRFYDSHQTGQLMSRRPSTCKACASSSATGSSSSSSTS